MIFHVFILFIGCATSAFAQNKGPTPEQVVKTIGLELRSAKTVGEWINKSSTKKKLFRRTYFSKYASEKIPQIIVSGSSLILFEKNKKKKPSVFRASVKGNELQFTWNGYDITKPKSIQLEKWFRKSFPKYSRTALLIPRQTPQWHPFFSVANAQQALPATIDQISQNNVYIDPNAISYWTAMMATMSAEEWETTNLEEQDGGEDSSVLTSAGSYMRDQYKLACSNDGKAQFDFPFSDFSDQPLRIGASYDASAKLARISIVRDRQDSSLPMPMGEIGRIAYSVMGSDGSVPGANIGKTYLYDGQTRVSSEHDSFRDGNFVTNLYMLANKTDGSVLAAPNGDSTNRMYDTTQGMVALADFARACCSNAFCRGQAQLPGGGGTSISQ